MGLSEQIKAEDMRSKESEEFGTLVCHFYEHVVHKDKSKTVNHCVSQGKARRTIYAIIQRDEETGDTKYRKPSGRPVSQATPKNVKKIEQAFKNNPNVSVRAVARKVRMATTTVSRIKLKRCMSMIRLVEQERDAA